MNDAKNDIMTLKEFADYIKAHENTVRKMIKSGQLAAFKVGKSKNSAYRIAKAEVLRLPLINLNELIDEKAEQKAKKNTCPDLL